MDLVRCSEYHAEDWIVEAVLFWILAADGGGDGALVGADDLVCSDACVCGGDGSMEKSIVIWSWWELVTWWDKLSGLVVWSGLVRCGGNNVLYYCSLLFLCERRRKFAVCRTQRARMNQRSNSSVFGTPFLRDSKKINRTVEAKALLFNRRIDAS